MKGLGFSQVEVCEIVRKSLFLFVKRPKRANDALNDCGKVDEMLCFLTYLHFKDSAFTSVKRDEKFSTRYVKGRLKR